MIRLLGTLGALPTFTACHTLPVLGWTCRHVRAVLQHRDPATLAKFESALVRSFVDQNRRARWCPRLPPCSNVLVAQGDVLGEPQCACGTAFCFLCGGAPHSPATCEMLKEWGKGLENDPSHLYLTVRPLPRAPCAPYNEGI